MNFTVYIFKIFRICKKQIAFFPYESGVKVEE